MRGAHAHIEIAKGAAIRQYDMNVHAQPVGMKAKRLPHARQSIQRIKRWLSVQHHAPIGIDAVAARFQQIINVLLLNAMAAQFHFDAGDLRSEEPTSELQSLIRTSYAFI